MVTKNAQCSQRSFIVSFALIIVFSYVTTYLCYFFWGNIASH
jgi:hypothetical protein